MKKSAIIFILGISIFFSSTVFAQGRAWRCPGNYYTNDIQEVKSIGDCSEIHGGNITVMPSSGRGSANSSRSPSTTTTPSRSPSSNMIVSSDVQQGRDNDAKKLLEKELQNKQGELMKLQNEFKNGEPERLLSEANDDTLYQSRIDRLEREISSKVADIEAIQNEISRIR